MLAAKPVPAVGECGDVVLDHQHTEIIADFAQLRVELRRRLYAAAMALIGLHKNGGDHRVVRCVIPPARVGKLEHFSDVLSAEHAAGGILLIKIAVVAMRVRNFYDFLPRRDVFHKVGIAREHAGKYGTAMIASIKRHDSVACALFHGDIMKIRQLCRQIAHRAAAYIEHDLTVVPHGSRSDGGKLLCQLHPGHCGVVWRKRHGFGLCEHGVEYALGAHAQIARRHRATDIQIFVAIHIPEHGPLLIFDHRRELLLSSAIHANFGATADGFHLCKLPKQLHGFLPDGMIPCHEIIPTASAFTAIAFPIATHFPDPPLYFLCYTQSFRPYVPYFFIRLRNASFRKY